MLAPLGPTDTRFLFRPVSAELLSLLRRTNAADWERPTIAGSWRVRDVVAHLIDLALRRVSFHRDQTAPPPPPFPIESEADFVRFINTINASWVDAARRFSPRVLTDLFANASKGLADWFEQLPMDAPALFGVSWAGEQTSEGWFDVGREFTELWHHQEQIRIALAVNSLEDPRYLRAVLEIAVRGLPHAFRDVPANEGQTVVLEVSGAAGGLWTLLRELNSWVLRGGEAEQATARVRIADDDAWKVLFNALRGTDAARAVQIQGAPELATPLLRARSVIV